MLPPGATGRRPPIACPPPFCSLSYPLQKEVFALEQDASDDVRTDPRLLRACKQEIARLCSDRDKHGGAVQVRAWGCASHPCTHCGARHVPAAAGAGMGQNTAACGDRGSACRSDAARPTCTPALSFTALPMLLPSPLSSQLPSEFSSHFPVTCRTACGTSRARWSGSARPSCSARWAPLPLIVIFG